MDLHLGGNGAKDAMCREWFRRAGVPALLDSCCYKKEYAMEKKRTLHSHRKAHICYHLMLLPAVLFVLLFNTRTWPGILAAFQDFVPTKGWFGSQWTGLRNFELFFRQPNCWQIVRNTMTIAIGKIVTGQVCAIAFALMLNEVRRPGLKKGIQTAVYLPHFVSWVIYATILKSIIGTGGLLNHLQAELGMGETMFLGTPSIFPLVLVLTETLKEFGFSAILYLSALASIDPGLYEAAQIDGASRWKQTIYVTIPGIRHIIVLNAVLSLGGILNAGFDQIFNLYNTLVMSTGDVIDTWVYRMGIVNMNYGVGTAVGLLRSVIALFLTALAYWMADRFADYKIF